MQSDKELLMLAAKAYGLPLPESGQYEYAEPGELTPRSWGIITYMGLGRVQYWNSLVDDGDCACLEAACEIDVRWTTIFVRACRELTEEPFWVNAREKFSDHGDKNKARRYASTRAAASLAQAAQGEMG